MAERGTPEWFDETSPEEQRKVLAAEGVILTPTVALGAMSEDDWGEYITARVETGRSRPEKFERVKAKYQELFGEELDPTEERAVKGTAGSITNLTEEDERTPKEIAADVVARLRNAAGGL
jgi:hypothetical protein